MTEHPGGLEESAQITRLLHAPPSAGALAWAEVSAGARIEGVQALRGGTTSAMHRLAFSDGRELVLRCYVRADVLEDEPDMPRREVAALRAVSSSLVPAPDIVAADEVGSAAGVPALLMTRLPGRVVWEPRHATTWLERLATVLPEIHGVDTNSDGLTKYFNYQQRSYDPPAWASQPHVWERAVEIFHGPLLETEQTFIHRDFHPGNVLWQRGQLSGVVDWQAACIGPPSIDIAHCRANFLLYRPELADEFATAAEGVSGRPFHRWADIAVLIGLLDVLRSNPPSGRARPPIENVLAAAVTECS